MDHTALQWVDEGTEGGNGIGGTAYECGLIVCSSSSASPPRPLPSVTVMSLLEETLPVPPFEVEQRAQIDSILDILQIHTLHTPDLLDLSDPAKGHNPPHLLR